MDTSRKRRPSRAPGPRAAAASGARILGAAHSRSLRPVSTHELEPGIVTDLTDRLTYGGYLRLDRLLAAQEPLSGGAAAPPRHDEMLFIIQHQVSELWMKLMIHELKAAIALRARRRARAVLQDPRAREADPEAAVRAVGGARDADAVRVRGVPPGARQLVRLPVRAVPRDRVPARQQERARCSTCSGTTRRRFAELDALLRAPSLYDEFLRHLARRGLPVPAACVERDFTQPYVRNPDLVAGLQDDLRAIRSEWWDAYEMCEKLVDVEESFQLWRFRHMKTVERIIGHKTGTGGSSGVTFPQARARPARSSPS